jgi:hypothetical protein
MGIIYLLRRAVELFIDENKVSALTLSKKLDLRYQVASIILDELELIGIISPFDDGGHVLLISSMDEFEEKAGEYYRSLFPVVKEELLEESHVSHYAEEEYFDESYNEELEDHKNESNSKVEEIGEHAFQSSVSRGGEVLFPEHVYIDDFEVTWEKKTGLFSKDTKTIPIDEVSQVDLTINLLSAKLIIRSSGSGNILAEHFSKSDAKKIKQLIEKVKSKKRDK